MQPSWNNRISTRTEMPFLLHLDMTDADQVQPATLEAVLPPALAIAPVLGKGCCDVPPVPLVLLVQLTVTDVGNDHEALRNAQHPLHSFLGLFLTRQILEDAVAEQAEKFAEWWERAEPFDIAKLKRLYGCS